MNRITPNQTKPKLNVLRILAWFCLCDSVYLLKCWMSDSIAVSDSYPNECAEMKRNSEGKWRKSAKWYRVHRITCCIYLDFCPIPNLFNGLIGFIRISISWSKSLSSANTLKCIHLIVLQLCVEKSSAYAICANLLVGRIRSVSTSNRKSTWPR